MKTKIDLVRVLHRLSACTEAQDWAATQPDALTAWRTCPRGDWLLWIAGHMADRKLVVRAACAVARTVLHLVPDGEERPRIAIETAERWTRGEATIEEVRAASYAASAAYSAAYSAAAYAASAATYADAAANAANAAAYVGAYARRLSLAESADIVRSIIAFEDLRLP